MSIFDRLGRVVRSEVNSLLDRIGAPTEEELKEAEEELAKEEADRRTRRRAQQSRRADAKPSTSSRFPKEVREAYAALELPLGSDADAVKKAYRRLMRTYHPDKHQNDPARLKTATLLTQRIKDAYETLNTHLGA